MDASPVPSVLVISSDSEDIAQAPRQEQGAPAPVLGVSQVRALSSPEGPPVDRVKRVKLPSGAPPPADSYHSPPDRGPVPGARIAAGIQSPPVGSVAGALLQHDASPAGSRLESPPERQAVAEQQHQSPPGVPARVPGHRDADQSPHNSPPAVAPAVADGVQTPDEFPETCTPYLKPLGQYQGATVEPLPPGHEVSQILQRIDAVRARVSARNLPQGQEPAPFLVRCCAAAEYVRPLLQPGGVLTKNESARAFGLLLAEKSLRVHGVGSIYIRRPGEAWRFHDVPSSATRVTLLPSVILCRCVFP